MRKLGCVRLMGLGFIWTGWYLLFGVFFGVLSFMRTNAYKQRTGNSPWHIHPIVWGVASVFVAIFGTLLSMIACSSAFHPSRGRGAGRDTGYANTRVPDFGATNQSGLAPPPARELAAWLPDPTGRHQLRYFDGSGWTEHVANAGVTSVDQF